MTIGCADDALNVIKEQTNKFSFAFNIIVEIISILNYNFQRFSIFLVNNNEIKLNINIFTLNITQMTVHLILT